MSQGKAGVARQVEARHGTVWRGKAGTAWLGKVSCGVSSKEWLGRRGMAGSGKVGSCAVRQVWLGESRWGMARLGKLRYGRLGEVR